MLRGWYKLTTLHRVYSHNTADLFVKFVGTSGFECPFPQNISILDFFPISLRMQFSIIVFI